jgi:RNA polymerase sigma-70 factor (ECF subfamily)
MKGEITLEDILCTIQKIRAGDVQLFEQIIESYQQPLFKYCFHMLGDFQEAEDAVQDSFVKAYEQLHKFTENISFNAWLYKITYNHCVNFLRRKKLIQFIPFIEDVKGTDDSLDGYFTKDQLSEDLLKGLSKLKIGDRSIIVLRVVEEKSYEEICLILNISKASARKKFERAMSKFKKYFFEEKGGIKNEGCIING